MFGLAPTAQDPVASYDRFDDGIYKDQKPGKRGFVASPDSVTTSLTGANNDLVIMSKGIRPAVGSIRVQYGIVGSTFPAARLYEGGTPATLKLSTSQGYQLATTFPGARGNQISLTLIDPGVASPLSLRAFPTGDIVVTLANSGSAITTVATDLIALINSSPNVNRWVVAWNDDSTKTAALTALPKTQFKGGVDDPFLLYVALVADTSSVVSTTATQVAALLNASQLVSASNSGADTGAGAVTIAGPLELTGGRLSAGEILQGDEVSLELRRLLRTPGQGEGHLTNTNIEVAPTRQGAGRTWQEVPQQDRAVIASSTINHQMEHGPRSIFL